MSGNTPSRQKRRPANRAHRGDKTNYSARYQNSRSTTKSVEEKNDIVDNFREITRDGKIIKIPNRYGHPCGEYDTEMVKGNFARVTFEAFLACEPDKPDGEWGGAHYVNAEDLWREGEGVILLTGKLTDLGSKVLEELKTPEMVQEKITLHEGPWDDHSVRNFLERHSMAESPDEAFNGAVGCSENGTRTVLCVEPS